MANGAERPLRSAVQLQARMAELQGMVKSGLLGESDIEDEVEELKGEAKAWRRRTAGAGGQLALGDTAAQLPPPLLPPPPPSALGPTPAATSSGAPARAAQPSPQAQRTIGTAWMRTRQARGRCSSRACCHRRRTQGGWARCARRRSWWRWGATGSDAPARMTSQHPRCARSVS